jgi:hypothetical protein
MLLGGMTVIGIYIWASEASFKATSPAVLSQVPTSPSIDIMGFGSQVASLCHAVFFCFRIHALLFQ